jgi:hypothetical protein
VYALRMRRRDQLVTWLTGELVASREREAAQQARTEARLGEHDAKMDALFAAMSDACKAAGLPVSPPGDTAPMPRLWLVEDAGRSA